MPLKSLEESLKKAQQSQQTALQGQTQQAQQGYETAKQQYESAYNATKQQEQSAFESTKAQHENAYQQAVSQYRNQEGKVKQSAEGLAQQAYVQKMQQQRVAPNVMQQAGLSGQGYGEAMLGRIETGYQQNWGDIMTSMQGSLNEINLEIDKLGSQNEQNLTLAEQQYLANLTAHKAQLEQNIAQAQGQLQQNLTGFQSQYQQNLSNLESQYHGQLYSHKNQIETEKRQQQLAIQQYAEQLRLQQRYSGGGGGGGDGKTVTGFDNIQNSIVGLGNVPSNQVWNELQKYVANKSLTTLQAQKIYEAWEASLKGGKTPAPKPSGSFAGRDSLTGWTTGVDNFASQPKAPTAPKNYSPNVGQNSNITRNQQIKLY